MLISTKGRYALRVLVDMAEHQTGDYIPLKEIAERQEISEKYLESIVKLLVKDGVLEGLRGKGGGYRLSRPADEISVREIIYLCEGSLSPVSCLGESPVRCSRMAECRTLPLWKGLDQVIQDYLDQYTVADLTRREELGNDYVI